MEARFRGEKAFRAATVLRANRDGTYDVRYSDGKKELAVAQRMIRRRRDAGDSGLADLPEIVPEAVSKLIALLQRKESKLRRLWSEAASRGRVKIAKVARILRDMDTKATPRTEQLFLNLLSCHGARRTAGLKHILALSYFEPESAASCTLHDAMLRAINRTAKRQRSDAEVLARSKFAAKDRKGSGHIRLRDVDSCLKDLCGDHAWRGGTMKEDFHRRFRSCKKRVGSEVVYEPMLQWLFEAAGPKGGQRAWQKALRQVQWLGDELAAEADGPRSGRRVRPLRRVCQELIGEDLGALSKEAFRELLLGLGLALGAGEIASVAEHCQSRGRCDAELLLDEAERAPRSAAEGGDESGGSEDSDGAASAENSSEASEAAGSRRTRRARRAGRETARPVHSFLRPRVLDALSELTHRGTVCRDVRELFEATMTEGDRSGTVPIRKLEGVLTKALRLRPSLDAQESRELLKAADTTRSESLSYEEMLALVVHRRDNAEVLAIHRHLSRAEPFSERGKTGRAVVEDILEELQAASGDESTVLSRAAFEKCLESIFGGDLSRKQRRRLAERFDPSDRGEVEYEAFVIWLAAGVDRASVTTKLMHQRALLEEQRVNVLREFKDIAKLLVNDAVSPMRAVRSGFRRAPVMLSAEDVKRVLQSTGFVLHASEVNQVFDAMAGGAKKTEKVDADSFRKLYVNSRRQGAVRPRYPALFHMRRERRRRRSKRQTEKLKGAGAGRGASGGAWTSSARSVIEEMFEFFDRDGSGFLDVEEFTKLLKCIYQRPVGGAEARSIFDDADEDGSGRISLRELMDACGELLLNAAYEASVASEAALREAFSRVAGAEERGLERPQFRDAIQGVGGFASGSNRADAGEADAIFDIMDRNLRVGRVRWQDFHALMDAYRRIYRGDGFEGILLRARGARPDALDAEERSLLDSIGMNSRDDEGWTDLAALGFGYMTVRAFHRTMLEHHRDAHRAMRLFMSPQELSAERLLRGVDAGYGTFMASLLREAGRRKAHTAKTLLAALRAECEVDLVRLGFVHTTLQQAKHEEEERLQRTWEGMRSSRRTALFGSPHSASKKRMPQLLKMLGLSEVLALRSHAPAAEPAEAPAVRVTRMSLVCVKDLPAAPTGAGGGDGARREVRMCMWRGPERLAKGAQVVVCRKGRWRGARGGDCLCFVHEVHEGDGTYDIHVLTPDGGGIARALSRSFREAHAPEREAPGALPAGRDECWRRVPAFLVRKIDLFYDRSARSRKGDGAPAAAAPTDCREGQWCGNVHCVPAAGAAGTGRELWSFGRETRDGFGDGLEEVMLLRRSGAVCDKVVSAARPSAAGDAEGWRGAPSAAVDCAAPNFAVFECCQWVKAEAAAGGGGGEDRDGDSGDDGGGGAGEEAQCLATGFAMLELQSLSIEQLRLCAAHSHSVEEEKVSGGSSFLIKVPVYADSPWMPSAIDAQQLTDAPAAAPSVAALYAQAKRAIGVSRLEPRLVLRVTFAARDDGINSSAFTAALEPSLPHPMIVPAGLAPLLAGYNVCVGEQLYRQSVHTAAAGKHKPRSQRGDCALTAYAGAFGDVLDSPALSRVALELAGESSAPRTAIEVLLDPFPASKKPPRLMFMEVMRRLWPLVTSVREDGEEADEAVAAEAVQSLRRAARSHGHRDLFHSTTLEAGARSRERRPAAAARDEGAEPAPLFRAFSTNEVTSTNPKPW